MTLEEARKDYSKSKKFMNEFRKHFIALWKQVIMLDRTGNKLKEVVKLAQKFGVYSPKSLPNDIKFSIMRHIHKTELIYVMPFHIWLKKNGRIKLR